MQEVKTCPFRPLPEQSTSFSDKMIWTIFHFIILNYLEGNQNRKTVSILVKVFIDKTKSFRKQIRHRDDGQPGTLANSLKLLLIEF